MWDTKYCDKVKEKIEASHNGGGVARIEKQHNSGKMTARERIEYLFDKGSFAEIGALQENHIGKENLTVKTVPGDGVVTGYGKINGRTVYVASQDFTVNGGTLGMAHALKICKIMDMALDAMCPFICINDSGGARIEEGIDSLSGYSGIFLRNTRASGVIPQISVILGPCAGGACYSPAISDFVFMTKKNSKMFITGPAVVKAVTFEDTTADELGGAVTHGTKSGVAHFVCKDEEECLDEVKKLLEYLPQNNIQNPLQVNGETVDNSDDLENIVPDNMRIAYDVHNVITSFIDKGSFMEVQKEFAKNVVVGFARIDGNVIGIVANQPLYLAGSLDIDSSDKAARFVRFCDCFNIPILSLVDVPGYMPGVKQESQGIIRHGAKLLYAFSEATVPKICLIMRKAYGGAYIAMNSKNMGADLVFAWPIAQLAVMGAQGAIEIIYKRDLKNSDNPEILKQQLMDEYEEKFMNPFLAAESGYIDEIILPETTRMRLAQAFEMLKNKKKVDPWRKHGNIPL